RKMLVLDDESSESSHDDEDMDEINHQKLQTLKSLINKNTGRGEYHYFRQLHPLISNWQVDFPNLRNTFSKEIIDELLCDTINYMIHRGHQDEGEAIIDFVIDSGYKDQPKFDENNEPSLFRDTPIHHAHERNLLYTDVIRKLFGIYNSLDMNYVDEFRGYTHFHVACRYGLVDVCEEFLDYGRVDPNECIARLTGDAPDPRGCEKNDDDDDDNLAKVFFETCDDARQWVEVDARNKWSNTPLHLATKYGRKKLVALLLRRGANPNLADAKGRTPLRICLTKRDPNLFQVFFQINDELKRSVRVNEMWQDPEEGRSMTPLQWAVANLMPYQVDVLLSHGADLSSFVFPSALHFSKSRLTLSIEDFWPTAMKFGRAFALLAIVERLQTRGYELAPSDALTIMKFFSMWQLFDKPVGLEKFREAMKIFSEWLGLFDSWAYLKKRWYDDEEFASEAEKLMVTEDLSLYDLIRLRPEEAVKRITCNDYYHFAYDTRFPRKHTRACANHMCEKMSRRFFRRWALNSIWEMTRYRLPIVCCDIVVGKLQNEDLMNICLANERHKWWWRYKNNRTASSHVKSFRPSSASNGSLKSVDSKSSRQQDCIRANDFDERLDNDVRFSDNEQTVTNSSETTSSTSLATITSTKKKKRRRLPRKPVHKIRKNYFCDDCGKKLANRRGLLLHLKTIHEGRKDFTCNKCGKKFTQKPHLLVHQRTVHEGRKDHACHKCEKKFGEKSTLIKHLNAVHKGRKDYACDKCEKKFGHKCNLVTHLKAIHEGQKDYACDKCEKNFGRRSHLIRHQKTIHEGRRDFAFHEGREDYKCDNCEKKFGRKIHMVTRQMTVHEDRNDFACDKCEKKFGRRSHLLRHQKTVHEGREDYHCDGCKKKFKSKASLLYHQRTFHEGRKDYACDICKKEFGSKQYLLLHQKTVHEGRKDFACDKCETKFGQKSDLLKHQRIVHEGCKDYACDNCEMKFGHKFNLLSHQKTVHEGRKDFACDKCEKKYGHKKGLLCHQKTVHEGRKDFVCDKCEKTFGYKWHLLGHQRTVHEGRKDFACDKCVKKFAQKPYLRLHQMIVHEGRKDYSCDNCDKKFGLKTDLFRHQKTVHEGRKDYACDNCEKKFGRRDHLLFHQRTIHEGRKD
ncbi:unnamed protein product, partial [Trichogramma brassicae]